MTEKKEITGYYTDDGNIYCVDCILKTEEQIREEIEKAITVNPHRVLYGDERGRTPGPLLGMG